MDVKQIVDGAMSNPASAARYVFFAILLIGVVAALYRAGPRFWRIVHDIFFTNWQLALLGSAAMVLSLAGGWTTWDGMTNFTGEPVLSLHVHVRHPWRDADRRLADRRELRNGHEHGAAAPA